jgi:hypothetical protein
MTVNTLIIITLNVIIVTVCKSSAVGQMSWCQINKKKQFSLFIGNASDEREKFSRAGTRGRGRVAVVFSAASHVGVGGLLAS